ncbi:MAG: hypothetical protein EOO20_26420, partial [Chryseobacterium sp.]
MRNNILNYLLSKRIALVINFVLILCLGNSSSLKAQQKVNNDISLQNFINPPDQSKPWAFFWWFNGYIDKPSITKHLEALKEKGFGGVQLYPSINAPDIPQGAKFMSPEWRELFKFAVKEANRLNLEMGVNICNGWPAGGAWITPESNSWITLSASQYISG